MFPTLLRSTAQGFMFGVVRIALGGWSLLLPTVQQAGFRTLSIVLALMLIVSGVVGIVMAPRGTARELDDDDEVRRALRARTERRSRQRLTLSSATESIVPEATGQGIRFEIRSWRAAVGTRDTANATGNVLGRRPRRSRPSPKTCRFPRTDHRGLATRPLGTTGVSMARTAVLGLPRIGPNRELKFALESFWAGRTGADELEATARALRRRELAARAGRRDRRDPVRRLLALRPRARHGVGAGRGRPRGGLLRARPRQRDAQAARADEVARHQLPLPRAGAASRDRPFELDASHWTGPLREAAALGIATRPVVLGPFSFLQLSKGAPRALEELVPVYEQLLRELAAAGATEVQLDEPYLALDRTARELDAVADAWTAFADAPVELCLATYFAPAEQRVFALGADEVHVDLVRAPEQLRAALQTTGGSRSACSTAATCGRPTSTSRSTGSTPRSPRWAPSA